ncbi:MAG TPA: 50S ribosomal protein L25 [Dehalococcoidia bacterium]|nr:50S ribosomal protein L25 [Dehalococcoidia bacterium]
MERLELEVSKREITGKKVRFLRREDIVPAKLYGHGIDSIPLQVDTKRLKQILAQAGKTDLISLKIADLKTSRKAIVREVQKNPLTDELLHVDFYQVKMTEKIKAEVPLVFTGDAPVLKSKDTSLLRLLDSLLIEALPDALPHNFEVDLSNLEETDQAIHVKDIRLGDGVTLLSDPEQMVVKVVEARREAVVVEAVEAEVEEVAAEPEAEVEPSAEE